MISLASRKSETYFYVIDTRTSFKRTPSDILSRKLSLPGNGRNTHSAVVHDLTSQLFIHLRTRIKEEIYFFLQKDRIRVGAKYYF